MKFIDESLLEQSTEETRAAFANDTARAVIRALAGAEIEVPSPTFTLVQAYELPGLRVTMGSGRQSLRPVRSDDDGQSARGIAPWLTECAMFDPPWVTYVRIRSDNSIRESSPLVPVRVPMVRTDADRGDGQPCRPEHLASALVASLR